MTDANFRSQLRLPIDIYEQLKAAAAESGRSLNAEITHRLSISLNSKAVIAAPERPQEKQKAELLLEFETWMRDAKRSRDDKRVYSDFCHLYNGADPNWDQVEPVYGIEKVAPRELRDLALAWRRYARESVYVHQFTDPTRPQRLAPERRKGKLLMSYLHWCNETAMAPLDGKALVGFCEYYNEGAHNSILDMPEISSGYLEELITTWLCDLPVQLAELPNKTNFSKMLLLSMQEQQKRILANIDEAISRLPDSDQP